VLVNLVIWVVIGATVGWLANHLAQGHGLGLALNAIIGAIGALVGTLTLSLVLPQQISLSMLSLYNSLVALVAAILFLGVARLATMRHDAHTTLPH
jgi:uncharacterized membrane protein YeaQ/YmgE (transglycosylase-associated protein family)